MQVDRPPCWYQWRSAKHVWPARKTACRTRRCYREAQRRRSVRVGGKNEQYQLTRKWDRFCWNHLFNLILTAAAIFRLQQLLSFYIACLFLVDRDGNSAFHYARFIQNNIQRKGRIIIYHQVGEGLAVGLDQESRVSYIFLTHAFPKADVLIEQVFFACEVLNFTLSLCASRYSFGRTTWHGFHKSSDRRNPVGAFLQRVDIKEV